ncbi:MAG: septal ring lytic transglycosylase RlpA family protein [Desulfuromonadaceae bacterium]|nr:septal ring lytic transglycosylase RlpA family protein [Desulfuromonadaceae bacterium]
MIAVLITERVRELASVALCISIIVVSSPVHADGLSGSDQSLLNELSTSTPAYQEEHSLKSTSFESVEGFASYYARRFEGRRTTSGHRYNPNKLTAAHESLPLGTVVRVVNPLNKKEVHVTINDRCARKSFHFIDLSRAAAKKIGLWGKGKIKVVITPLIEDTVEEPA